MLDALNELQERAMLNGGASGQINSSIAKLVLAKHGYHDRVDVDGNLTVNLIAYRRDQEVLDE